MRGFGTEKPAAEDDVKGSGEAAEDDVKGSGEDARLPVSLFVRSQ